MCNVKFDKDSFVKFWKLVFNVAPKIEFDSDPNGPEGFGSEIWINDILAIWPGERSEQTSTTFGKRNSCHESCWNLSVIKTIHNYPVAPDDCDYSNESQHTNLSSLMIDAAKLWAQISAESYFDAIAEDSFFKELRLDNLIQDF